MNDHAAHPDVTSITPLLLDTAELIAKRLDVDLKQLYSVGLSQYRVMREVEASPGISQKEIALSLSQSEASISRQVELLQYDGILVVRRKASDRRERQITLTSSGAHTLEELEAHIQSFTDHLINPQTQAHLHEALSHLKSCL